MSFDDSSGNHTRRDVLRGAAIAGTTAIGATTTGTAAEASINDIKERGTPKLAPGDGDRTVSIRARGEASYSFSVTGVLDATGAPDKALSQGEASATLREGTHKYSFSGEFTAFDIEGDAEVYVDGSTFDVDAFPQNTLSIIAQGPADVDVSASGAVVVENGSLERPNARTARGTVRGRTTISYAGELTYFEIDGSAWVRKNGQWTSTEELLPTSLPGELTISGSGTRADVTVSGEADTDSRNASVSNGRVSGSPTRSGTTARYDGRVETIELADGASAEIVPESKRIVCSAPEDSSVEFAAESTEAFIYDEEVHKKPQITVAAGETERIQYFGDVTTVTIDSITVSFDYDRYPAAESSARLQMAAEFERESAYDRLRREADGRIRHDVDGIYAVSSEVAEEPVDGVLFKLTDIGRADEGALSITKGRESDEIVDAKNSYQWRTDSGQLDKTKVATLTVGGASTMSAASLKTETYEYDLPDGASDQQVEAQGDWLPTIPWGDWIGDIYDGLKDVASDIQGVTADYLASAIEYADISKSEIAVTGGKILCNTINSFQKLATKFIDDVKIKALWKLRITGYSSMISLVGSGVFEAIGNQNHDCGACIAFIRLSLDVGLCGYGVGAFCSAFSLTTLGLGTVPCAVLGGAICSAVISALPDARDICSGHTAPTEADFC